MAGLQAFLLVGMPILEMDLDGQRLEDRRFRSLESVQQEPATLQDPVTLLRRRRTSPIKVHLVDPDFCRAIVLEHPFRRLHGSFPDDATVVALERV